MSKQCQVLDINGNQCKNEAVKQINYHGDREIYYVYGSDDEM